MLSTISKYLDIAGPLLALIFCLFYFRNKKKAGDHLVILGYLGIQLITNSIAKYLMFQRINNINIYQANAFLSLLIIGIWFYSIFKLIMNTSQKKQLFLYALISFLLMLVIIFFENTGYLNSISLMFTSFNVCLLSVIYYLKNLMEPNENNFEKNGKFWITSGLFIYYGSCFFIFMAYKLFGQIGVKKFGMLWSFQNFFLFLACCILVIAAQKLTTNENDKQY